MIIINCGFGKIYIPHSAPALWYQGIWSSVLGPLLILAAVTVANDNCLTKGVSSMLRLAGEEESSPDSFVMKILLVRQK